MRVALFTLLIAVARPAAAIVMECPKMDTCCETGNSAEAAQDWIALHEVVNGAQGCDDGWVAELYSDKVSMLLADHWPLVSQLGPIVASDSSFEEFVLRHIDETVSAERHARIRELATTQCPKGLSGLCKSVAQRTQ